MHNVKGNRTQQAFRILLAAFGLAFWTGLVVLVSFLALKIVRF